MTSGPAPPTNHAQTASFAAFEALPVAVYATDAEGMLTHYNAHAARLWGRHPVLGEVRFCGALRLFTAGGNPLPFEAAPLALSLSEGQSRPAEFMIERPDGSRVLVAARPTLAFDAAGRVSGATVVLVDLPGIRPDDGGPGEARRRIAGIAERRLAAIIESSDDAILAKDLNGIITDFNQGAERLFGYTAAEIVGKPVTVLIPTDRLDEEPQILERIRGGHRIDHYETVRQRKDGSLVEISISVSPIRAPDGSIVGASKIARDITERRRAEERQHLLLREVNHRVKNLFALSSSLINLSARHAATPQELATIVGARLSALARAHDLTLSKADAGAAATTLHALARTILSPFDIPSEDRRRVVIGGTDLPVSGGAVTGLALLLHEFATNAAKYGALSTLSGSITIETAIEDGEMLLDWSERGGPKLVSETGAEGFGSVLVRATARGQLGGTVARQFAPQGIAIRLTVPVARLTAD